MIQLKTNLQVSDNSGAQIVECISIFKGSKIGKPGMVITVSIKKIRSRTLKQTRLWKKGIMKNGNVRNGIIIRTKQPVKRLDGRLISCESNGIILLNRENQIIFTRINSVVTKEIRKYNSKYKNLKLFALAGDLL